MKTPAIIVAFTIVGSLAFAAGQARVVPPQSPDQPSLPPMSGGKQGGSGGEGGVAMQMGQEDDCVTIGSPLNVFTNIHPFPSCVAQSWGDAGIIARGRTLVDLDGDGDEERLFVRFRSWTPTPGGAYECREFYEDSFGNLNGCPGMESWTILWMETMTWTGTSVAVVHQPLLDYWDGLWRCMYRLNQLIPGYQHYLDEWRLVDLRDIDQDGDLDLVVGLIGERYLLPDGGGLEPFSEFLWLENTASFNNTVGADVNRDGVVDGKDLAFVLSGWTQ